MVNEKAIRKVTVIDKLNLINPFVETSTWIVLNYFIHDTFNRIEGCTHFGLFRRLQD